MTRWQSSATTNHSSWINGLKRLSLDQRRKLVRRGEPWYAIMAVLEAAAHHDTLCYSPYTGEGRAHTPELRDALDNLRKQLCE